jgi:hypothetical protein
MIEKRMMIVDELGVMDEGIRVCKDEKDMCK